MRKFWGVLALLVASVLACPTASAAPVHDAAPGGGRYHYEFHFAIAHYTRPSPQSVLQFAINNFGLFPVSGNCPSRIRPGLTCQLSGGNPARIAAIGPTYFQIQSLPGHLEGPDKFITFAFHQDRSAAGFTWLDVVADGPNNTTCNRIWICSRLNVEFAKGLWQAYANRFMARLDPRLMQESVAIDA